MIKLHHLAPLLLLLLTATAASQSFDGCQQHLPFGAPAIKKSADTTPVCHVGYALLHDDKALVPRWVAYRLTGDQTLGCVKRTNNFHADARLQPERRARPTDYIGSGYDQGHQAPAQDFATSIDRMKESFSMANMAPQKPGLNRAQWLRLEETVRVWATDRKTLNIYVGPILLNAKRGIGQRKVLIPTAFWKVVVDPQKKEALAFVMPQQSIAKGKLEPWQSSIEDVEQATGITLPLPSGIDREAKPPLWTADLKIWNKKHKIACGR